MKEQLLEAWRTANNMTLMLLDALDPQAMSATLSVRGGRTVQQQLVHLNTIRLQWLDVSGYKVAGIKPEADLHSALIASSAAVEQLIDASWEKGGKVKGYKSGLIPFISYLIAHESHHRGNILLTIKQSGLKIPEQLKWGLWKW